jgi:hypothetical protein
MKKQNAKQAQVLKLRAAKTASAFKHAKAPTKGTIAATIAKGLDAGHDCERILATVQKKHKGCKTSLACVYWYSSKRGAVLSKAA